MKKKVQAIFLKIQRWNPFVLKYRARKSIKKRFLACASRVEKQKENCCASDRPWQHSFWLNATTNQQCRGANLSNTMIANKS
jgi:hypothetical protein